MILDLNSLLSGSLNASGGLDGQAITADAASTNVYDLGAPAVLPFKGAGTVGATLIRNLGKAGHIPLLIQVVEAFATCTSVTVQVQVDDNSAFSSPKTIAEDTILLADLTLGKISSIDKVPRGVNERYMRLYYVVNGSDATAGKIIAGIVGAVDGSY